MSDMHSRRSFGKWLCAQATVATALPIAGSAAGGAAFIATLATHFDWVHSSDYHDAYKNPQPGFADVRIGETPWARQVEAALEAGLIDNHRGILDPEQPVTRSESATLYARAFGVEVPAVTQLMQAVGGSGREDGPWSGANASKLLARLAATVVAPPQVLCKSGTTAPRRYVQLLTPTAGATFRYTVTSDGSEPADPLSAAGRVYDLREDGVLQFTNPLDSTTDYRLYRMKAVALREGLGHSAVREYAHDKRNLKTFLDTIARKPYDLVVGHNTPTTPGRCTTSRPPVFACTSRRRNKASFVASPRADYRAAGKKASRSGEIMQVTNTHQEQPVAMRCVENFVRCFQQLVDEGNDVAQPLIRGGLKGVEVHWAAPANGVANRLPGKFDPWTYDYRITLDPGRREVSLRPRTLSTRCQSLKVNGRRLRSDDWITIPSQPGGRIEIEVVAADGHSTSIYRIAIS